MGDVLFRERRGQITLLRIRALLLGERWIHTSYGQPFRPEPMMVGAVSYQRECYLAMLEMTGQPQAGGT